MKFIDFIGIWENTLDDETCEKIINFIENSEKQKSFEQSTLLRKDQFCSLSDDHELAVIINDKLSVCLDEYTKEYSALLESDYTNPEIKLQKTEPCGGYHTFHCENVGMSFCFRGLAWMIYLNDISQNEGETEFLYQKLRVNPKQGTLLIWPAGFTHTHRGNPVYSKNKYIATGWFFYTPKGGSFTIM